MRQWGQRRYHPRRATPEEFLFKILGQLCSGEMGDFLTFKSLPSFPRAAAEPGRAGRHLFLLSWFSLTVNTAVDFKCWTHPEYKFWLKSSVPSKDDRGNSTGWFFWWKPQSHDYKSKFFCNSQSRKNPGSPGIDRSWETGLGPRGAGEASHRGQFLRNALREMSPQFSLSLQPLFSIPQCLSRSLFDH